MNKLQPVNIALFALLLSVFCGCTGSANNTVVGSQPAESGHMVANHPSQEKINFDDPVILDSTENILYPLTINYDGSTLSKKDYQSALFWNMAFYNTISGQYHLLDDKRKMIITSFRLADEHSDLSDKNKASRKTNTNDFIFYTIIVDDFNKDGKLDTDDPAYLFVSDKKGGFLKQVTPNNMKVASWQITGKGRKLLINILADSNHDKIFDEDDQKTPYIYDSKAGTPAKPVFGATFNNATGDLFKKQWSTKK